MNLIKAILKYIFRIVWAIDRCQPKISVSRIVDMVMKDKIDVVIGHLCSQGNPFNLTL